MFLPLRLPGVGAHIQLSHKLKRRHGNPFGGHPFFRSCCAVYVRSLRRMP